MARKCRKGYKRVCVKRKKKMGRPKRVGRPKKVGRSKRVGRPRIKKHRRKSVKGKGIVGWLLGSVAKELLPVIGRASMNLLRDQGYAAKKQIVNRFSPPLKGWVDSAIDAFLKEIGAKKPLYKWTKAVTDKLIADSRRAGMTEAQIRTFKRKFPEYYPSA